MILPKNNITGFLKEVFRLHDFGHLFGFIPFINLEPIVTQHNKNATLQQQVPVKEETERLLMNTQIFDSDNNNFELL